MLKSSEMLQVDRYIWYWDVNARFSVIAIGKDVTTLQHYILLESKGPYYDCDDTTGQWRKMRNKLASRLGKQKTELHFKI